MDVMFAQAKIGGITFQNRVLGAATDEGMADDAGCPRVENHSLSPLSKEDSIIKKLKDVLADYPIYVKLYVHSR